MKRRILSVILAAMMTISLAACGSGESRESEKGKNGKELKKITFVLDWTPN